MKATLILSTILTTLFLVGCQKSDSSALNSTTETKAYEFLGLPFDNFGNNDGSIFIDINPDTVHSGTTYKDVSRGMTIQSDGKILIFGDTSTTNPSGPTDGFVARVNANGSLDTSFNNTGIFQFNSSYDRRDYFFDVKVKNNYIYAFGSSRTTTASTSATSIIVRLNMNGSVDTSFGTNGVAFLSSETSFAMRAVIDDAGVMYLMSYNVPVSGRQYFVTKVNANGSVDTTFGVNGIYAYPSGITYTEGDIVLDDNGKIITTFTAGTSSSDYKSIIIRLNSNGTLDNSFATNGIYELNFGLKNYSRNIIFHKNDIIVSAVSTQDNTIWAGLLLKLDDSGTPVSTWGVNGVMDYTTNDTGEQLGLMQARTYKDTIIVSGDDATDFRTSSLDAETGAIDLKFGGDGIYSSTSSSPSIKGSWLQVDEIRNSFWISGNAGTSSSNQMIHLSKFK